MKKSEAVSLIKDVVDNFGGRSTHELAKEILESLLDVGVKPPYYDSHTTINGVKYAEPGEAEDFMKWEPET